MQTTVSRSCDSPQIVSHQPRQTSGDAELLLSLGGMNVIREPAPDTAASSNRGSPASGSGGISPTNSAGYQHHQRYGSRPNSSTNTSATNSVISSTGGGGGGKKSKKKKVRMGAVSVGLALTHSQEKLKSFLKSSECKIARLTGPDAPRNREPINGQFEDASEIDQRSFGQRPYSNSGTGGYASPPFGYFSLHPTTLSLHPPSATYHFYPNTPMPSPMGVGAPGAPTPTPNFFPNTNSGFRQTTFVGGFPNGNNNNNNNNGMQPQFQQRFPHPGMNYPQQQQQPQQSQNTQQAFQPHQPKSGRSQPPNYHQQQQQQQQQQPMAPNQSSSSSSSAAINPAAAFLEFAAAASRQQKYQQQQNQQQQQQQQQQSQHHPQLQYNLKQTLEKAAMQQYMPKSNGSNASSGNTSKQNEGVNNNNSVSSNRVSSGSNSNGASFHQQNNNNSTTGQGTPQVSAMMALAAAREQNDPAAAAALLRRLQTQRHQGPPPGVTAPLNPQHTPQPLMDEMRAFSAAVQQQQKQKEMMEMQQRQQHQMQGFPAFPLAPPKNQKDSNQPPFIVDGEIVPSLIDDDVKYMDKLPMLAPVKPDKEKKKPVTEDNITHCDVLLGRGGMTNHHIGNMHFRTLVNNHKMHYVKAKKGDKGMLSKKLTNYVRHKNGRFLGKDEKDGLWYECGDHRAYAKFAQALREGTADIVREIMEVGDEELDEYSDQEASKKKNSRSPPPPPAPAMAPAPMTGPAKVPIAPTHNSVVANFPSLAQMRAYRPPGAPNPFFTSNNFNTVAPKPAPAPASVQTPLHQAPEQTAPSPRCVSAQEKESKQRKTPIKIEDRPEKMEFEQAVRGMVADDERRKRLKIHHVESESESEDDDDDCDYI